MARHALPIMACLLAVVLVDVSTPLVGFLSGMSPSRTVAQPSGMEAVSQTALRPVKQRSSSASNVATASLLLAAASLAAARGRKSQPARQAVVARQACFDTCVCTVGSAVAPAEMSFAGSSRVAAVPVAGTVEESSPTGMNLLMPKNIKWKKPHKPSTKPFRASTKWKFRGYNTHGAKPHFGKYALQALEEAWITSKQIENTRRAIIRTMERKGKMWIRVFPHQAVTQRVAESRMGAGKGTIEYWVAPVRPNFILFEIDGVTQDCATTAFRKAKFRLPCKVRMLVKDGPSQFELGLAGKPGRGSGERTKFEGASK